MVNEIWWDTEIVIQYYTNSHTHNTLLLVEPKFILDPSGFCCFPRPWFWNGWSLLRMEVVWFPGGWWVPEEVTDSLAYHFYDFKDSRFRYRICYSLHEDFKEAKEKNHKVPAPMCDKLGIGQNLGTSHFMQLRTHVFCGCPCSPIYRRWFSNCAPTSILESSTYFIFLVDLTWSYHLSNLNPPISQFFQWIILVFEAGREARINDLKPEPTPWEFLGNIRPNGDCVKFANGVVTVVTHLLSCTDMADFGMVYHKWRLGCWPGFHLKFRQFFEHLGKFE